MKKKSSEDKKVLFKKLAAYSASAGAILGVGSNAQAQIDYTQLDDTLVLVEGVMSQYEINFAGGDAELVFRVNKGATINNTGQAYLSAINETYYSGPLRTGSSGYGDAAVLSSQSEIPGTAFQFAGSGGRLVVYTSGGSTYGNFANANGKYLGVRFAISGVYHYGWILVDVHVMSNFFKIKSMAYEETAGKPILAGAGLAKTSQRDGDFNWDNTTTDGWENDSLPGKSTDVTIATGTTTISENVGCNDLTISAGAKLTVSSGKSLTINGDLIIESPSGTGVSGSLLSEGTITITGNTIIKRYVGQDLFAYVSPPISDAQSDIFDVDFGGDNFHKAYWWDEANHAWEQIEDQITNLNVMQGYVAYFDDAAKTIEFSGSLNSGNKSIALTRTSGTKEGWNLVGNPYPSALDWGDLTNDPSGPAWTQKLNIESSIYYRSGGQFHAYNSASGIGTLNGQRYIPAMQAFWVRVLDGETSGTLEANDTIRVHDDTDFYKAKDNEKNVIRLFLSNVEFRDELVVFINNNATEEYSEFDSEKMFESNENVPQLFSQKSGHDLVMHAIPELENDIQIEISYQVGSQGMYSISTNNLDLMTGAKNLMLEDKHAAIFIDLGKNPVYEFSSNAGDFTDRFVLHMTNSASAINSIEKAGISVYSDTKRLYVKANSDILDNSEVEIYSITGQKLYTRQIAGSGTIEMPFKSGIYVVKIVTEKEIFTKKIFLK